MHNPSELGYSLAAPFASGVRSPRPGLTVSAATIVGLATYLAATISPRQAILFVVGVLAGLALYHAAFGFTSSWRQFIATGRGAGLRAQMLMLALTCAIFFPLLAQGAIFGQPLRGSISPPGVAVIVGAFMFGMGMQLGGGCASGTLSSVGGGNARMVLTLLFFIVGSVIGTAHAPFWAATPALPPTSLVTLYGPWLGLAICLTVFGAITMATLVVERRRHGALEGESTRATGESATSRWLAGPWPLVAGAVALAVVNISTLLLAGRPWGVTSAFALWGAKTLDAAGVGVASWPYWTAPAQRASLEASVFADVTSVMDVGIVLGALAASMLAGRFAPTRTISGRSLAAAIGGGLLLGYGARIAYGCNIGAYFSGIASGSLHGWVWLVAAFIGNVFGVRLRPLFGLPVEGRTPRA